MKVGLFDRIFPRRERDSIAQGTFDTLTAYTPAFTSWNGKIYESELVRSAIRAKAEHISKMSVKVMGAARPTLQTKLNAAPNEWQTWSQFLARLAAIYEVNNTAFIVPVIDQYGDTTGIYPVLPMQTSIVQYNGEPYLRYQFNNGKTAAVELKRCGIMVKHQYKSDFFGETNGALDQTMALLDLQNQGIREGVKSSATFRFMAQLTNFTKPEDLEKEQDRFGNLHFGKKNKSGFILFPNTYSNIQQINSKPFVVDAEQVKLINTNVYNYFGVNEKVMQNSANADELDAFYSGALEPFAIQLSEVLTKMLFSLREQASGAKIIVTADRLQYMSVTNKISLIQTLGDRGMLTINEARELLNYHPVENGDDMMPIRGEYYNNAEEEKNDGD